MKKSTKSLFMVILCYTLWAVFPLYFKALGEVSAYEILASRIVWSFVFLFAIALFSKKRAHIFTELKTVLTSPKLLLRCALAAILITTNWLTYITAVNTGHILEASFGYYLNPVISIVLAVILLHEHLSKLQQLSLSIVFIALIYLTVSMGQLPWISLIIAISFGLYGFVKKTMTLSTITGLMMETFITTPFALVYLVRLSQQQLGHYQFERLDLMLLLIISGVVTAVPLILFAQGAKDLSLSTIGILQYITPTGQFLLGLWLYNESFDRHKLIGFTLIWLAVLLFIRESVIKRRQTLLSSTTTKMNHE